MNQTEKYEDYLLGIVLEGLSRTERFVVIRQNSVVKVNGLRAKGSITYDSAFVDQMDIDDFNHTFVDLDLFRKDLEQDNIVGFKNKKELKRYIEDVVVPRRKNVQ